MVTRASLVAEARSWIGTPFHHQAFVKNLGCDCVGLLMGVGMATRILPEDFTNTPEFQQFAGYPRVPDGRMLRAACERFMRPISREEMTFGDVVLFTIVREPQHVGMLAPYKFGGFSVIHAAQRSNGSGSVVETRLMFSERLRFDGAYRLPGVED